MLQRVPNAEMSLINRKNMGEALDQKQAQRITMHAQSELPDKGRAIKGLVVC